MTGLTVRWKLTLWNIGTLALLLIVFVLADIVGLRRNLTQSIDDSINTALDNASESIRQSGTSTFIMDLDSTKKLGAVFKDAIGDNPAIVFLCIEKSDRCASIFEQGPEAATWKSMLKSPAREKSEILLRLANITRSRFYERRIHFGENRTAVLFAFISIKDLIQTWRSAIIEHILLAGFLMAILGLVSYLFIKRAFRPVRRLVEGTRAITADDLSSRVDSFGDKGEIGDLAATLNDLIARIERSFVQTKRFSSDVAHELTTPLTVLKGELEIALKKDRSPEEYRDTLSRLADEVDSLQKIIENLLTLARLEANGAKIPQTVISLDQVALECFENLERAARDRKVLMDIDRLDKVEVQADPMMVGRMISNILENAIKFTSQNGTVSIGLQAHHESATLWIKDDGIGIPQDDIPTIFNRFYRVDPSRSKRQGGVGLGLAIVKQTADFYGLDVKVESALGKGTTISIVWPLLGGQSSGKK